MSINAYAFTGYSAALDSLEDHQLDQTSELIWSYRSGSLSVCWVTEDLETFIEVLGGSAPEVVTNNQSSRYAVDLESLDDDTVRLYIDSPEDDEVLIGYYFPYLSQAAEPSEYKIYKRAGGKGVAIDRYTGSGSLISSDEGEVQTDAKEDWRGPVPLYDICVGQPGTLRVLKKTQKDQSYLRLTGY